MLLPASLIVFAASLLIFASYPLLLKIHRSVEYRKHILEIYSLLGALSRSARDIDYIMTVAAESLGDKLGKPFEVYLYNRSILGMSAVESLRMAGRRCPYKGLKEAFMNIADALETTGDPSRILNHLFERSIIEKRGELEKKVRNSMLIGEFYISLTVVLPMILLVMMVVFSMIGGDIFGLDPAILIALITYFTLPLSLMMYLMVGEG